VIVTAVLCGLLGLPAGWFAQVLVDRIPDRLPLLRPVPAVPRQGRALLVVAVTVVLYGAAGLRFAGDPGELVGALVLFCALVALTFIDIDHQRLPDRITGPAYLAMMAIIVVSSLWTRQPERIRWALLGAAIYVVGLGIGWLIGMGFGDVKAGGVMGLYVGWLGTSAVHSVSLTLWALIIGTSTASVYGIMARRRHRRSADGADGRQWFAFGPFLVLGAVIVILFGPALVPAR
jgi:leader peptidase (prepilin peptidase)/N-methyltransferase